MSGMRSFSYIEVDRRPDQIIADSNGYAWGGTRLIDGIPHIAVDRVKSLVDGCQIVGSDT